MTLTYRNDRIKSHLILSFMSVLYKMSQENHPFFKNWHTKSRDEKDSLQLWIQDGYSVLEPILSQKCLFDLLLSSCYLTSKVPYKHTNLKSIKVSRRRIGSLYTDGEGLNILEISMHLKDKY